MNKSKLAGLVALLSICTLMTQPIAAFADKGGGNHSGSGHTEDSDKGDDDSQTGGDADDNDDDDKVTNPTNPTPSPTTPASRASKVRRVSFRGTVSAKPSGKVGAWSVGGRRVRVTAATRVQQRTAKASVGRRVTVSGVLNKDGSITATSVIVNR